MGVLAALAFAVSHLAVRYLCGTGYQAETAAGWVVAVVFNITGLIIKRRSINRDVRHFLILALIVNAVNLALFFAVIAWFLRGFPLAGQPFILAVFVAYFTMLIYDIRTLKKPSM